VLSRAWKCWIAGVESSRVELAGAESSLEVLDCRCGVESSLQVLSRAWKCWIAGVESSLQVLSRAWKC